jgi:hypothetical protein
MPIDSRVTHCEVCFVKFGFITRRHWCRRCRKTICSNCSSCFKDSIKAHLLRRHDDNHCRLCEEAQRCAEGEKACSIATARRISSLESPVASRYLPPSQNGNSPSSAAVLLAPRRVNSVEPKGRPVTLGESIRRRNASVCAGAWNTDNDGSITSRRRSSSVVFLGEENENSSSTETPRPTTCDPKPESAARPAGILRDRRINA